MQGAFFEYASTGLQERAGQLAFLPNRPARDWTLILDHAEVRRFGAGDEVIRAGDRDRTLLILTAGELAVLAPGDGRRLKTIHAPSVVGEVAFLDGGPRSLTLQASTPCEVVQLSLDAFEVIAAKDPELGRAILLDLGRIVAARLRMLTERLGG